MELDHQYDLVPLLERLNSLVYVSAKELLHEIDSLTMETALQLFWRLACILYDDEQDKLQSNFDEWVHRAIFDVVPDDCDEFLHAIFLNDIHEKIRLAQEISPKLALVIASPKRKIEDAKNVPSYLKDRNFKFGKNTIPGSAVWALIMGDISQFFSLDLSWIFLFTLHLWNSDDSISSSLLTAFSSFSNVIQSKIKTHEQDPIYLLMKYYSGDFAKNYADKLLSDIASLLPPLDMYFFLKIFQAMDHGVSENSISLAMNIAQYQLIQMDCLIESVDILNNPMRDSQEIFQIAQYAVSPERGLTDIEHHLIKNCSNVLDKKYIYFFKGCKAQLLQEQFSGSKSLDYAGRATDFFLQAAGFSPSRHDTSSTNSTTYSNDSNDGDFNANSNASGNSNSNDSNDGEFNANGNGIGNDSDFNDDDFDLEDINQEYFQYANYQAYDVYLVKSMIKGEGINKLFEWSGKFARFPDLADISDGTQIYKIFEAIKVADNGGIVESSLLETIADEIKKNTKLYTRFRYFVASSNLYKQPNGFALFSELEMTPKAKLLEIYENAYQ